MEEKSIPLHQQRSHAADKETQQKEREKRVKDLRIDMALTFDNPHGRNVLRWILNECGYHKAQVGGNPALGMNVMEGTLYNAARESLYIELRQLIPNDVLKKVEYQDIEEIIE